MSRIPFTSLGAAALDNVLGALPKINCPDHLRNPLTGVCGENLKVDPVTGKVYIEPATMPWHVGYKPPPAPTHSMGDVEAPPAAPAAASSKTPWIIGGLAVGAAALAVAVVATRRSK